MVSKNRIVCTPPLFNHKVMNDISPYVELLKDEYEIIIISDMYTNEVERNGVKYINNNSSLAKQYIHTSEYIIDAGAINSLEKLYANQKRISVWHGVPYKNLFIKHSRNNYGSSIKYSTRYDFMISSSKYYSNDFLRDSLLYQGNIIESGSARFDSAFENTGLKLSEKINPDNKKVILYAPTYRDVKSDEILDLDLLFEIMDEEYIIILRNHHYIKNTKTSSKIIDLSNHGDVNEILSITDILITDYSSLIFDFALRSKKIILFQSDLHEYMQNRGLMFDMSKYIDKQFIVNDMEELYTAITSDVINNSDKIISEFLPYENGTSTLRICNEIKFKNDVRLIADIVILIESLYNNENIVNQINELIVKIKDNFNTRIIVMCESLYPKILDGTNTIKVNCDVEIIKESNLDTYNLFLKDSVIPMIVIDVDVFNNIQDDVSSRFILIAQYKNYLDKNYNLNNFTYFMSNDKLKSDLLEEYFIFKMSFSKIIDLLKNEIYRINQNSITLKKNYVSPNDNNILNDKSDFVNEDLVSVIIPFYNNSDTVKATIKSVLEQTYSFIEIILINDGSFIEPNITATLDKSIKYYYKDNQGLGLTRNYGIDKSNGKYIFFLDADDTIPNNAIQDLYNFSVSNNLEVVSGLTIRKNLSNNSTTSWCSKIYSSNRIINKESIYTMQPDTLATNKLYDKNFLVDYNIRFDTGLFEDKLFINKVYSNVEKYGVISNNVYTWIVYGNDSSITTRIDITNFEHRINRIFDIWDFLDENTKLYNYNFVISHDFRIYFDNFKNFNENENRIIYDNMVKFIMMGSEYFCYQLHNSMISIKMYHVLMSSDYEKFILNANLVSVMYTKNFGLYFKDTFYDFDKKVLSEFIYTYHEIGKVKKRQEIYYSNNIKEINTTCYCKNGIRVSTNYTKLISKKLDESLLILFKDKKRTSAKKVKITATGKIVEYFKYFSYGNVKSKESEFYNANNKLFKKIINNYYGE